MLLPKMYSHKKTSAFFFPILLFSLLVKQFFFKKRHFSRNLTRVFLFVNIFQGRVGVGVGLISIIRLILCVCGQGFHCVFLLVSLLLQWAHFPHIQFGLMPDQAVKKSNVRQQVLKTIAFFFLW